MPAAEPASDPAPRGARPSPALTVVVVTVLTEVLLLLGVTVVLFGEIVLGGAAEPLSGAVTGLLAAVVGGFLAFCARALWRRQRWARGPVICWQLLQLLTAATTVTADRWWVPGLLVVAALVAGVGLLLPRVIAETTVSADPPVL